MIALGEQERRGSRHAVRTLLRKNGSIFFEPEALQQKIEKLQDPAATVFRFIQENSHSPFQDIVDGTGLSFALVDTGLETLVKTGLVSCDDYDTLLRVLQAEAKTDSAATSSWHEQIKPAWQAPKTYRGRRRPRPPKQTIHERQKRHKGRWFAVTAFAVMGKRQSREERIEAQARLLLQRYGIVVKDFYRREKGLLPWYPIFQALKRMEWRGEIRRGYFVQGLSGVQFATEAALRELQKQQMHGTNDRGALLSLGDPALPLGGLMPWGLTNADGEPIQLVRQSGNHLFFHCGEASAYLENYAARIQFCTEQQSAAAAPLARAIKTWLQLPAPLRPRKRLIIETINGAPAAVHALASVFIQHKFETDGDALVLWPSNA